MIAQPHSIYRFPPQATIVQNLTQNSSTADPHLPNIKIISKVAAFFTDKRLDTHQINIGVLQCLCDLNDELKLPILDFIKTQQTFVQALIECAGGKPMENRISKL